MTAATAPATTPGTTPGKGPAAPVRRSVARHSGVVAAQVVAGLGNLGFSLAAVHVLAPGAYAHFAAFLAAYLLLNTPAASLTAGASLRPGLARAWQPLMLRLGVVVGVVLAAGSPWLAGWSGLSVPLVLLLAAAAPAAGILALARGGLFGQQRIGAASLATVAEPAARLGVGLVLLPLVGDLGAAVGVVAGGWLALGASLVLRHRAPAPAAGDDTLRGAAPATVTAFLLLAVIGAQDVLVANRVLGGGQAGLFAAVSTLGGAVLFATSTVPLVVLAQLRDRQRRSLVTALIVVGVTSLAGTAVLVALPQHVLAVLLGDAAGPAGALLPRYLLAMTLLCLARVLLAALCSNGRGAVVVVGCLVAAAVQLVLVLGAASARDVADATLVGSGVLFVVLAAASLVRTPTAEPAGLPAADPVDTPVPPIAAALEQDVTHDLDAPTTPAPDRGSRAVLRRRRARRQDRYLIAGLVVAAVLVRVATNRSVWIDEAISVHEASQPYGTMLQLLRDSDVHPPLYFTLLWGVIHVSGDTAEYVVRLPSLVPGAVLVAVTFLAARDVWDRRTARVAGVIAVIGPAAVWYSQDARMYALFMLFSTVAAWAAIRVLRDGRWRDVGVLTGACAALVWTQYHSALVVATVLGVLVGVGAARAVRHRGGRLLLQALVSGAVLAAAVAPLLPWIAQQYGHTAGLSASLPNQAGKTADTGVNAYSVLTDGVWAVFGYHSDRAMVLINALWPVLLLGVLGALGRGSSQAVRVFAAVGLVPAAVLFVVAQRRADMFDLRYFSAIVPMANLLLARLVVTWPTGRLTKALLPPLVCLSLVAGLVDEQLNRSNPRIYDFRSAVTWVREHARPGDVLYYGPQYLTAELQYYEPGLTIRPITAEPSVAAGHKVFVLASFLTTRSVAAQVGTAVDSLDRNRTRAARVRFPNVTVWEYR